MSDDNETTFHFSPELVGRLDPLVLGIQTCAECRHRQTSTWPIATDVEALVFECARCGAAEASFTVAYPLEMFPDFDMHVRSRRAWLEVIPRAPFKES